LNTVMCKFESSQKDESRAHSPDSSKAYSKLGTFIRFAESEVKHPTPDCDFPKFPTPTFPNFRLPTPDSNSLLYSKGNEIWLLKSMEIVVHSKKPMIQQKFQKKLYHFSRNSQFMSVM